MMSDVDNTVQMLTEFDKKTNVYEQPGHTCDSIYCWGGQGQYHTNEADPRKPDKRLTPYIPTTWANIKGLVDNPIKTPKKKGLWIIPSTFPSRQAKAQEANGEYRIQWLDIDDTDLTMDEIEALLVGIIGESDYEIYSSKRATLSNQKCRILIPLSSLLSCSDWKLTQQLLNEAFEAKGVQCDRSNTKPAQILYLPNRGEFYTSRSVRHGS